MTPNEVATFIRGIDSSFDDLGKRFSSRSIYFYLYFTLSGA